ncbi:MAG: hypothetical protein WBC30_07185, partial [Candidatus Sulfotelmatobacter sp.]
LTIARRFNAGYEGIGETPSRKTQRIFAPKSDIPMLAPNIYTAVGRNHEFMRLARPDSRYTAGI